MLVTFRGRGIGRFGEHVIDGKKQAEVFLLRFVEQIAREIELVLFHQGLPYRLALRFQKRVSHGSADEHGVGQLHQILHHLDFVGHFRAAEHRDEWLFRMRDGLAEIRELLFHQQARGGLLHEFGDAHNRSMRAMRGAESIADEKLIAERGKLFRKAFVVGFFFGMESHVLEQQHAAVA